MPGIRRDFLAYSVLLALGLAAAAAIHLNEVASLKSAQARFRAESHAATLAAQNIAQTQLNDVYQSLRTISRLPSVRKTDRYAKNINPDGIDTIQELYNNLANNVAVSEVYIVPSSLDADQIDQVTQAPQTPILMFDDNIADDAAGGNVTKRFEAEIYEYHLLHSQILWFAAHTPNIKSTDGIDVPMISGHQVITCDNTVYNTSLKDADRTGAIFSVPFFDMDGNFKGAISAIIRLKAIRALLPAQNFALVNPGYNLLMISPHGGIDPANLALAAQAKPDAQAIYSEVLPLAVNDPDHGWSLWVTIPDTIYYARPDVRAAHAVATGAYAVLAVLLLIILTVIRLIFANARLIARATRALNALAGGDENVTLQVASKSAEINELAGAFNKFRESLREKRQLEQRATAEAAAAQAERQRFDTERAQSLADQKQVVDALAAALISLTSGDLTFKIRAVFSADYKTLSADFNQASAKMEATMRRVMNSTETVEAGARDIEKANAEIARRTEAQAAQLEQTAAALNEITDTVRQTSQNAGNAAQLAATARQDADTSSDVVKDTLNAMTGIESSSKQIANIIGVIDEIAFQTNLLALNAGVEAARAGDAGRGFAVVATEVRALAQRSANAAKEIKTIISAAGTQVGGGVRLVHQTGQALLRITGQITQLNDLVRDISDAARQQATSLQQLNQSVGQMDQATQQNARMVEHAANAGASLTNEASSLGLLVSEFKISPAETPSSRPVQTLNRPKLAVIS